MAEVYCGSEPCPLFLNSTCVFYTGESLLYIGVQNNDTLETIIVKINQAFQNAGVGYAFTNGLIQPTPFQPVQLGGALTQNTTIGGNFTLSFTGNVQAARHITTGGSSSQFVKGDGTLDSTAYQPAANYITGLSGDATASGPGVAAMTLSTVNFAPGTFGNGNTIPIVTVNAKGLVTNITPVPVTIPPLPLNFIGDVVGSGFTGSNITLLLQNVNANPYNTITPLKFSVNGKGLVTSASPITASDIVNILGYNPGTSGTSGTDGTSGTSGTTGTSGTSGTSGSDGTSGTSGTTGTSGTSGTDGSGGTSGTSGTSATAGTSGSSGTSGTTGTSGTSATSGTSGTSGTDGTGGTSGTSGTSATAGTSGTSGSTGTSGTSGTTGTSGSSGTSGSTGTSGSSGTTGTSGSSGTTGTSGSSGTSGTTGTSGSSGTSGTTGTSGTSGVSGDKYETTSTSTYTLQPAGGTGTITVGTGLAYSIAQSIIIAYDANNHNEAEITSYDALTGVLSFIVYRLTGSGTYSFWFVNLDGASGGDGTSGTSGTTGTSGSSGTSGTTGTSGSSGTSGTTGTSGSSGTSGTSATNGTGGTSGTSGSSGTSGTTGTSGTSATSGTSGTSATSGTTGTSGTSGTNGTGGTSGTSGTSATSGTSGSSGTSPASQVTGTGTSGQVAYWNSSSSITGESAFTWNASSDILSINGWVDSYRRFRLYFNDIQTLAAELYEDGASTNGGTLTLYGKASGTIDTIISAAPTKLNYINNAANVMIGWNTDQGYKLAVNGGFYASGSVTAGSWFTAQNNFGLEVRNSANTAGRNVIKLNASNQIEIGRDSDISAIRLGTASAVDAFTMLSNGNVGIAFTNPSQALQVNGRVRVSPDSSNGGDLAVNDGGLALSAIGSAPIQFWRSNYNFLSMIIDSNGNLGVGTTNLPFRVNIESTSEAVARIKSTSASGAARLILNPEGAGAGSTGDASIFFDCNNSAWVAGIDKSDASRFKIAVDPFGDFRAGVQLSIENLTDRSNVVIGGSISPPNNAAGRGNLTINGTSSNILQFTQGGLERGYFFHGGTDSELWNTTNGYLRFGTSNTEAMRIFSSRNVHIGPTPGSDNGARLQVSGTATFTNTVTASDNIVMLGGEFYYGNTSSNQFARNFVTGTSGSATLNYSFWNGSSWQTVSTLNSTGAATFSSSVTAGGTIVASLDQGSNNQFFNLTGTQSGFAQTYSFGIVGSSRDFRIFDITANQQRLTITSSGNVGIGTPSPSSRLQSNNSSTFNSSTPTGAIIASNLSANNAIVDIGVDSSVLGYIQSRNVSNTTTYNLLLNPLGGNVGIGTNSPVYTLDVRGRIYAGTSLLIGESGGGYSIIESTGGNGIWLRPNGISSPGGMFLTTGGNVGIGTTTTTSALSGSARVLAIVDNTTANLGSVRVYGGGTATSLELYGGASAVGLFGSTNHPMVFSTNNVEAMRITSDRNIIYTSNNAANASFDLNYRFSTPDSARIRFSTTSAFNQNEPGELSFWTRANDAQGGGAITERMRITSNGNVGIGIISPSINLHVAGTNNSAVGTSTFWNFAFAGAEITNLSNTVGTVAGLALIGGSSRGSVSAIANILESTGTGQLAFFTGGGSTGTVPERMRITSGGNVLIGTVDNNGYRTRIVGTTNVLDLRSTSTDARINIGHSGNGGFIGYNNSGVGGNTFYVTTGSGVVGAGIIMNNNGNVGLNNSSPLGRLHVTSTGITASSPSLGWPVYNAENDANARNIYIDTEGNGGVATAGNGATVVVNIGQYFDSRVVITPPGSGGASPSDQGSGRGKDMMIKAGTSDNTSGYRGGRLYLNGGMGFGAGAFNTNGGDILMQSLTGSGNVLVGLSSDIGGRLQVAGQVRAESHAIYRAGSFRGGLYTYADVTGTGTDRGMTIFAEGGTDNGNIYFCPNGSITRVMTINTSSNVLIGTTTDGGVNRVLSVQRDQNGVSSVAMINPSTGSAASAQFIISANNASGFYGAFSSTHSTTNWAGRSVFGTNALGGGITISAHNSGQDIRFLTESTSNIRMVVASNGNVLINTTDNPGATLHVNGTIRTGQLPGAIQNAVNWRLGTARGGPVTSNATVRVEIDGVLVDLVARYV